MDTNGDFDPLEQQPAPMNKTADEVVLPEGISVSQFNAIKARQEAYTRLAERFYGLWIRLPGMTTRDVDRELVDMFQLYVELAPSMGVTMLSLRTLRECCGQKREWKDNPILGNPGDQITGQMEVKAPEEVLSWCPGDVIRRITRFFGAKYCEKCDRRRRAINAFFRCGGA